MAGAPVESSVALLQRLQGGDTAAWGDLYLRYRDRLLFAIRRRLGPHLRARIESEDVLQSVVRQAFAGLHDFVPQGDGALAKYLHVCVLNMIRKKAGYFGAQRRDGAVPLTDSVAATLTTAQEPGLRYVDADRYERLERGLARLQEPMRTVVELRACEGLAHAEIAAQIGRSEEATKKLYQRAIARLGVMLAEDVP